MKLDDIEKFLRGKFPEAPFQVDETRRSGVRWSITIPVSGLPDAAKAFDDEKFFLDTVTALDFQDTLELVYHFNCYEPDSRVALRVLVGHDQSAPSIVEIFRGAGWLEREVHDFFGIEFSGNPDLRPLLLPEDADYHPLRKTFGKTGTYLKREEIYG